MMVNLGKANDEKTINGNATTVACGTSNQGVDKFVYKVT